MYHSYKPAPSVIESFFRMYLRTALRRILSYSIVLAALFDRLLQLALAELIGLDSLWPQVLGQLNLTKLGHLTGQQCVLTADLTFKPNCYTIENRDTSPTCKPLAKRPLMQTWKP